jgi:hypothetical protein
MSGAQAILSFTSHSTLSTQSSANLHWLLALYDYLNDDDEEIRDIAASATVPILGKPLISIEASVQLLSRLTELYGATDEFRTHVACRMIGHNSSHMDSALALWGLSENDEEKEEASPLRSWTPAESQLARAMRFDDSLFVVEEQNLYIDEVRETLRWRDVFLSLPYPTSDVALAALTDWTAAGLRTLARLAGDTNGGDDGVLGWTSKPEVFAICSRIVASGAALAGNHADVEEELRKFLEEGKVTRVHGLLLGLCAGP